jgi:hypothetical protein
MVLSITQQHYLHMFFTRSFMDDLDVSPYVSHIYNNCHSYDILTQKHEITELSLLLLCHVGGHYFCQSIV